MIQRPQSVAIQIHNMSQCGGLLKVDSNCSRNLIQDSVAYSALFMILQRLVRYVAANFCRLGCTPGDLWGYGRNSKKVPRVLC
eukprot:g12545.t1